MFYLSVLFTRLAVSVTYMIYQLSLTDTKLIIKMSVRNTEVRNSVLKFYIFKPYRQEFHSELQSK